MLKLVTLNAGMFDSSEPNDLFTSGGTATAVTNALAKDCKFLHMLEEGEAGSLERIILERHIAASGPIIFMDVCPRLNIVYAE